MEYKDFDVVVVGAGGAGVAAAATAAGLGARVALVAKEPIGYGNTRVAMGALAHGRLASEDSPEVFYEDMVRGGEGLNDPRLAKVVATEAPDGVRLLETYGLFFRRDDEGRLSLAVGTRGGGHSIARTVRTMSLGIGIGQTIRSASARSGLSVYEGLLASKLLVRGNKVSGLVGLRIADGETVVLSARAVILAAGGAGWLYFPHTTCIRAATGDGYALALDAGAQLVDMEQVQFVPFGINHPEAYVGLFLGEPGLAGPAGRLLNGRGEVVLTGISTMTRAQVTRAMAEELAKGGGTKYGGLLLDLMPNFTGPDGEALKKRVILGDIVERIGTAYGKKAARVDEPWDVSPSVHFHMGGVATDEWGKTSVDGLYAVGEVAGGVHGGNRLGSVALTELFVMGRRAGEDSVSFAKSVEEGKLDQDELVGEERLLAGLRGTSGEHRPIALVRELQQVMWEKVGIARTESSCQAALEKVDYLDAAAQNLAISSHRRANLELADAIELRHMLKAARSIVLAALQRQESRGAHFRLDFPGHDEELGRQNTLTYLENGRMQAGLRPVGSATMSAQ